MLILENLMQHYALPVWDVALAKGEPVTLLQSLIIKISPSDITLATLPNALPSWGNFSCQLGKETANSDPILGFTQILEIMTRCSIASQIHILSFSLQMGSVTCVYIHLT